MRVRSRFIVDFGWGEKHQNSISAGDDMVDNTLVYCKADKKNYRWTDSTLMTCLNI